MYKETSRILCITNRSLTNDFLAQLRIIGDAAPRAVILREKDLSKEAYISLVREAKQIFARKDVPLILHTYFDVAKQLGIDKIHLPLQKLVEMPWNERKNFTQIGVSIHSKEEAIKAQKLGATYLTAGHIFLTDCKKGVPPRGIPFLQEVCGSVIIPVYAIGGINEKNAGACKKAGAAGVCIMSSFMQTEDVINLRKGIDASFFCDI